MATIALAACTAGPEQLEAQRLVVAHEGTRPPARDSVRVLHMFATWPIDERDAVSSHFGARLPSFAGASVDHRGTDWAIAYGEPVYSIAAGTVTHTGSSRFGYGNQITIQHAPPHETITTVYAHLADVPLLRAGDIVLLGEAIGRVGSTGVSSGPHLHFELHQAGVQVDPVVWLVANAA